MSRLVGLIAKAPLKVWFLAIFILVVIMAFAGLPWFINLGLFVVAGVIAFGLFFYFGIRSIG